MLTPIPQTASRRRMGHDIVEHAGQAYSIPRHGTLLRPAEALAAYAAIRLAHHHSPALNSHYRHALHSISPAWATAACTGGLVPVDTRLAAQLTYEPLKPCVGAAAARATLAASPAT